MRYPIDVLVDYPERLSRWLNNPLLFWIKWLLAIPHLIIVQLLGYLAGIVIIISSFAILFTGRYPKGLFDIVAMYARWYMRTYTYVFLLTDKYPPFSGGEETEYPVRIPIERAEGQSRWLNAPILFAIKWILLIPHLIILAAYAAAGLAVTVIAMFAILFTGRYPRGLFEFNVGWFRWLYRVLAYGLFLFTDQYPPFSNKPSGELAG